MNRSNIVFFVILFLIPVLSIAQSEWKELFNGKDLSGWNQKGGKAKYLVENGEIIGVATPDTPNSFLTTVKPYDNFILELEFYIDSDLNSGIQFRSNSIPEYQNGKFHGYQMEIDPSSRAYTGGIYDESRRGWLYPLAINSPARAALKFGRWNKVRIEAIGNSINTWINDIHCARLVDDMTGSGFIGLQVHNINDKALVGAKVKWRNIRILTSNLEHERKTLDASVPEVSYLINKLSDREKRQGWQLLWDGGTSSGWRGAKLDKFPDQGWTMKDGILSVQGTEGKESAGPGDIITVNQYGNFELELEFLLTDGANSGVKYFVDPQLNKGSGSAIGCEFQLLDDQKHPDSKMGVKGNRTLGSLYDLIPATNLSIPGRDKTFKGIGSWNKLRIISNNGRVEHWLNNELVVTYDRFSQVFKALVNYSKYASWPDFGTYQQGHILLQDHGNEVKFRSIKIREL